MANILVATHGREFTIFRSFTADDVDRLNESDFFDGVTEYACDYFLVGEDGRFIMLTNPKADLLGSGECQVVPWSDDTWSIPDGDARLQGWCCTAQGGADEIHEEALATWLAEMTGEAEVG